MTLVEFLRARLDEDEQIAQAANPPPWRLRPAGTEHRLAEHVIFGGSYPGDMDKLRQVADLEAAWERAANAKHITRHDPARVLADVAAKMAILDAYDHAAQSWQEAIVNHDVEALPIRTARLIALEFAARQLSTPYAAHPDYNPAWQPAEVSAYADHAQLLEGGCTMTTPTAEQQQQRFEIGDRVSVWIPAPGRRSVELLRVAYTGMVVAVKGDHLYDIAGDESSDLHQDVPGFIVTRRDLNSYVESVCDMLKQNGFETKRAKDVTLRDGQTFTWVSVFSAIDGQYLYTLTFAQSQES